MTAVPTLISNRIARLRNHPLESALWGLVILGALLRAYGLAWDGGLSFHPDERNICWAVQSIRLPGHADPHFYAYGAFTVYVGRIIAQALEAATGNPAWVTACSHINLVLRLLSMVASLASLYVGWRLFRMLLGERWGLVATALLAVTAGLVQAAHYGTTESVLVLLLVLTAYYATALVAGSMLPNRRFLAITGILVGLAFGTKIVSLSFLILPIAALWMVGDKSWKSYVRLLGYSLILLGITGTVAFAVSPYTILNRAESFPIIKIESDIALGKLLMHYTLQFRNTLRYVFPFLNLAWLTGPVTAWLALGALAGSFYRIRRPAGRPFLPIVLFSAAYVLFIGRSPVQFVRYWVPLVPFIILGAAAACRYLVSTYPNAGKAVLAFVMATQTLWSVALASTYLEPHPLLQAHDWLAAHAKGRTVMVEMHDEFVVTDQLKLVGNDITFPDTDQKREELANKLASVEYVVLSSERFSTNMVRNADMYPMSSRYFTLLASGDLGYQEVARFTRPPRLGPLRIPERSSEETFRVFERPDVRIYRNTGRLNQEELDLLLRVP